MIDVPIVPAEPMSQSEDALTHMSQAAFVAAWQIFVGEPPAMMLDSRSAMIRLLVESTPAAQLEQLSEPARSHPTGHKASVRTIP